ncbi:MAG: hypothetical protein ABIC04_04645 [Nanoarchaeota archaeon]
MKFLISFSETTKAYDQYRQQKINKGQTSGSSTVFTGDGGGKIALFEQKGPFEPITELDSIVVDRPYGLKYVTGEGLYYTAGAPCTKDGVFSDQRIERIGLTGEKDLVIRKELFSLPRTVNRTENGLLVCSCGLDSIIEIGLDGDIFWNWNAVENGFPIAKNGKPRRIRQDIDHRAMKYPTNDQTTHPNSAIEHPHIEDTILATFYVQDGIYEINKITGKATPVKENLQKPHHIRYNNGEFTVANTKNGSMMILDPTYRVLAEHQIHYEHSTQPPGFKFVKDAIKTPNNTYFLGDVANFHLVEIDGLGMSKRYDLHRPNRLFQIEFVPDSFCLTQKSHYKGVS